jgi:hypothetical protein
MSGSGGWSETGRLVDSTRAMLVWEPKRIVPAYAVPVEDIDAELSAKPVSSASEPSGVAAIDAPRFAGRLVFDPSIPFSVHTSEGEPLTIHAPGADREAAAFRPSDADLDGYILLDFEGSALGIADERLVRPVTPWSPISTRRRRRGLGSTLGPQLARFASEILANSPDRSSIHISHESWHVCASGRWQDWAMANLVPIGPTRPGTTT